MKTPFSYRSFALTVLICLGALPARAQWVTQTLSLKSGWNGVYLHVDGSHVPIRDLPESIKIDEIWLWQPAATSDQFVQDPRQPGATGSQWKSWKRADAINQLDRLSGNAAYLIRVASDVTWDLKGKPLVPNYKWSVTGLNFFGYPTSPATPPTFQQFFEQETDVSRTLEAYYYVGGPFSSVDPKNPRTLENNQLAAKSVRRGEAYWLDAHSEYFRGYGPLELTLAGPLDFGDSIGQRSFRIRNLRAQPIVATIRLKASQAPPAGQQNIAGLTPILVRGDRNPTTLVYGYSELPAEGTKSFSLASVGQPGSEVEVILGIKRTAVTGPAGSLLAGVLQITDSLGYSQIDLPLTATIGSTAGLWVGQAAVTSVNSYLKSYAIGDDGLPAQNPDGSYVINSINTNAGPVMRPFPLRLIVHHDGTNSLLLQRVFHGLNTASQPILALKENTLASTHLSTARRITSPHLPWTTTNTAWPISGLFKQGAALSSTVTLLHSDHASNPFLHTYHPDHDNLDATFQTIQVQGVESYGITRKIFLGITAPPNDFEAITASATTMSGDYAEDITISGDGAEKRTFHVAGIFSLSRISTISNLTP